MARISYDEQVASAYKAVREVPRDGLLDWRDAVERHVQPARDTTLLDLGAGTGQFATAFDSWFGAAVVAVEPSDAMRARIPQLSRVQVLEGSATDIPLPDASADAAWMSLVLHHISDLEAAARELRRVLRPGAPVLIRQGFADTNHHGIELVRWFPETERVILSYPSAAETSVVFATAGFPEASLEQVCETRRGGLADLLAEMDTLRRGDTSMRSITEDEFLAGRERLSRAVHEGRDETRENWLDLLVVR